MLGTIVGSSVVLPDESHRNKGYEDNLNVHDVLPLSCARCVPAPLLPDLCAAAAAAAACELEAELIQTSLNDKTGDIPTKIDRLTLSLICASIVPWLVIASYKTFQ